MSSNGKKEYSLIINGVEKHIQDFIRLNEVVVVYDSTMSKASQSGKNFSATTKTGSKALTDEEKAAKKLAETEKRLEQVKNGATKAQIAANQELQKATRATTLQVKESMAVENSIEKMRIQLSLMKEEWKGMDVGSEAFQQMSADILELNNRIKEAEMSTGDFRRNVGNYESALEGLGKLSEGVEGATKSTMGLAQGLLGANALMGLFGKENEESAEQAAKLQKILALLSLVEQVNTNVLKEGIIQNKLAVVTDGIRATQLKAKMAAETAGTKGTIAATIAQKAFNLVASANPYVLLALALVAVGTALFAFAKNTETATEKQKKLNEVQNEHLDIIGQEISLSEKLAAQRIADREAQIRILEMQGGKEKEIHKLERENLADSRALAVEKSKKYKEQLKDLDKNIAALKTYQGYMEWLTADARKGAKEVKLDIDLDGKLERYEIEDAKKAVQEQLDKYGPLVTFGVEARDALSEQDNKEKEQREKEANEAKERAKELASVELTARRAAEDSKLQLITESYEKEKAITEKRYERQIEDLKKRLSTETNLTTKARKAINEQISSLEKLKEKDLEKLDKEKKEKEVSLDRELQDAILSAMTDGTDKQLAEIGARNRRLIDSVEERMRGEEGATKEGMERLTKLRDTYYERWMQEYDEAQADDAKRQANTYLSSLETAFSSAQNKLGDLVKRESGGLNLIDVDATRDNLREMDSVLNEYIGGLSGYLDKLKVSHDAMLSTLKKGTPEYEAEMLQYAKATEDANKRIKEAQDKQAENAKLSSGLTLDYWKDFTGKLAEQAQAAADAIGMITDVLNQALQAQLDELNEQMDVLNEQYDNAQAKREEHSSKVEELENKLENASGARADAIREELKEEVNARDKAQREEEKIAKQKEKLEAQIAKKEKQMKRNELISNIAIGLANVAQAVTKALTAGPIVGQVLAGITAALGAVQVGIMTKQLAKLEKGGEIIGPSHANGGVPIPGTNYEAEGGEFVVNKVSYGANEGLIRFINDTPRGVTMADLMGVVPAGSAPVVSSTMTSSGEDRIVEAIKGIEMRPVVAVTDVIDAMDEVTEIRDLAGI